MEMQVVVLLIGVFFTQGLALVCQECSLFIPQGCFSRECPSECSSISLAANLGGVQVEHKFQTCVDYSVLCFKGSVNTGLLKVSYNSKCCKTDNCNNQSLPVLPKQPPNGKKCCANSDCSETVKCEGDEDHCVNATVVPPGFNVTVKGCATKSVCDAFKSLQPQFPVTVNVKCCEGNLCNGVSNIAMSINLLVTLGSLLCSILFL